MLSLWKLIFNLGKDVDLTKPLTEKILSNPNHNITKLILYIYSMESFVFTEMNSVTRNKDTSKIDIYGPFASALGYII